MSLIFLDTSALLKLFLPEVGSAWLRAMSAPEQVTTSELVLYECATVLRRRWLEGTIAFPQMVSLYTQIEHDSTQWYIILLRAERQLERVVTLTRNLPAPLRVRALDAIHLAAAGVAREAADGLTPPEPFVFVSADRQLLVVAQAQGFVTENPEDHP